jgi:dihydroflavonol-4-reductase
MPSPADRPAHDDRAASAPRENGAAGVPDWSGRTALVTGATGFVGSAVARALLAAGAEVRVLARRGSDRRNLVGLSVDVREGDLTDRGSLERAIRGCGHVFHVAADYRIWRPDPRVFFQVNVDGTRSLLEAATQAGVERFVYTSSVATLGLAAPGTVGDAAVADETTPRKPEHLVGPYKQSKAEAEDVVVEHARAGRLDVVIVNPAAPIGPRDVKPTPTGRTILEAAAGRMPAFVDTGLNVVHVDDVAEGHLLAHARGRTGERYVLGGDNLTLRDILATVASLRGHRPPRVRLAPGLLMPFAHVAQAFARVRGGREPMLTVDALRMARKRMWFSSAKAERELGYRHRPAEEAIRDAIAWFEDEGMLVKRARPKAAEAC